ncbi:hypothetical protein, partial [Nonomuraea turkmeniaca]|uniref:hypothetical protein n=1 Tax=Nonomuraea turkmeniaca TaxID=103838 RepID=UPI001B876669
MDRRIPRKTIPNTRLEKRHPLACFAAENDVEGRLRRWMRQACGQFCGFLPFLPTVTGVYWGRVAGG